MRHRLHAAHAAIRLLAAASLVISGLLIQVGTAAARTLVDPSSLNPPPPAFFNADCQRTGGHIVCTLAFVDPPFVNEPSGLICDGIELLETGQRRVEGKRFYDAAGNLTRRHFREDLVGALRNPVTGKVAEWVGGDTIIHNLTIPGELSTGATQISGAYVRFSVANRTVLTDAGSWLEDAGTGEFLRISGHHPLVDYGTDAEAIAPLCAALD